MVTGLRRAGRAIVEAVITVCLLIFLAAPGAFPALLMLALLSELAVLALVFCARRRSAARIRRARKHAMKRATELARAGTRIFLFLVLMILPW